MSLFSASLPQDDGPLLRAERRLAIDAARLVYNYAYGVDNLLMPLATAAGPLKEALGQPRWVALQVENNTRIEQDIKAWQDNTKKQSPPIANLADYARIFQQFPIPANAGTWQDDGVFANQRLAGLNPMVLERVTADGAVGLGWETLRARLSPAIDEAALGAALGQPSTWEAAIAAGQLYVADYRALASVTGDSNAVGDEQGRRLLAPIGLFVRRAGEQGLRPLAIQLGQKPTDPVHTPNPTPAWLMARTFLQTADLNLNQLVNHLSLVHLIQDAFAVGMHRSLDDRHPVARLMKHHFRAMLIINFGGEKVLVGSKGIVAKILEGGAVGSADLINNAYRTWSFEQLDPTLNLRQRGVDDPALLPYFPYRDDGARIWGLLGEYVRDYLALYYGAPGAEGTDARVAGDWELQAWAAELSADAKGPGQVKGFPAKIEDFNTLARVLHLMIWTAGPQHAAVNFPQVEFAGFVPNLPGANYTPPIAGTVTLANLMELMPPPQQTADQFRTTWQLAGVHLDSLLDYADDFDGDTQKLIASYHSRLAGPVTTAIQAANQQRQQAGLLEYPWLLPANIPNSTSV